MSPRAAKAGSADMAWSERLAAGGIVSRSAKLPKSERLSVVMASRYAHPALATSIVRLCPKPLLEALDLEMDVLGFEERKKAHAQDVGKERERALGFPGAAIVSDPKNARYALDVVQEFRRGTRNAESKPGHARDAVVKVGERLGRQVPHFLPSFYEEAGRRFIQAGSPKMASQMFGKAREAERVHGLAVDEDARRKTFLEFALRGAVSTKELSNYAKQLRDGLPAAEAYAHFRELALKRTLGGMPPWSGMAKELRKMAKAAKLDVAAEDNTLITELVSAPSLKRAAGEFWKSYRKAVVAVASESAEIRGRLLNLFPSPAGHAAKFDPFWLELLEECGALDPLLSEAGSKDAEVQPEGGPVVWVSKLCTHALRGWEGRFYGPELFELVRRFKPVLTAAGGELPPGQKWGRLELELCEIALECGVEVGLAEHPRFDLRRWFRAFSEHPEKACNPVLTSAHPKLGPLFVEAVAEVISEPDFETVSAGKQAFADAKRHWLEGQITSLSDGALPAAKEALERIENAASAALFRDTKTTHEALSQVDIAEVLARQLSLGVLEELGVPEVDTALLAADDLKSAKLFIAAPWAIAVVGKRATACGPKGQIIEHDLRFTPSRKKSLEGFRVVDGALLCMWEEGYETEGYWSDKPSDKFELPYTWYASQPVAFSLPISGGRVSYGGMPHTRGDRELIGGNPFHFDGESAFRFDWEKGVLTCFEFDPETGKRGRASLPSFFEEFAKSGYSLDLNECMYFVTEQGETSEQGSASLLRLGPKGAVGRRVRIKEGSTRRELETAAGDRFEFEQDDPHRHLLGLIDWPSSETPLLVCDGESYQGGPVLRSHDGQLQLSTMRDDEARGAHVGTLPLMIWPRLRVRDEAASKWLRSVKPKQARALIDAAKADAQAGDSTNAALTKQLAKVTHPLLHAAVSTMVEEGAALEERLLRILRDNDPSAAMDPSQQWNALPLRNALSGLTGISSYGLASIDGGTDLRRFFSCLDARAKEPLAVPEMMFKPLHYLRCLPAVALQLARHADGDETRVACEAFLHALLKTPVVMERERFRIIVLTGVPEWEELMEDTDALYISQGESDYFVYDESHAWSDGDTEFTVLERRRGDAFALPKDGNLVSEHVLANAWGSAGEIESLLSASEGKDGPVFERALGELIAEEAGLSYSEAALFWSVLPGFNTYEKNFLPKPLRTQMGLKVAEAATAKQTLLERTRAKLRQAYAGAIPAEPSVLFEDPAAAASTLAKSFKDAFGESRSVTLDPDVLAQAEKAGIESLWLALRMFAEPDTDKGLTLDPAYVFNDEGIEPKDDSAFTTLAIDMVIATVPFVFELPVGHVLRAGIAKVAELCDERLAHEDLLHEVGEHDFEYDEEGVNAKRFIDMFGGKKVKGTEHIYDDGVFYADVEFWGATIHVRAAKLSDKRVRERAKALVPDGRFGESLQDVRSGALHAFAERVKSSPVPEGKYEQNPLLSHPKLLKKVSKELALSEQGAMLYLQTLALPNPTKKRVMLWNEWKPKAYKQACEELVTKELLTVAKRARAGRAHFLPGGWQAMKAPHPPIETWKLPLYKAEVESSHHVSSPTERFAALTPVHLLFEAAWKRISKGDAPKYEDVPGKTSKTPKTKERGTRR